MAFEVEHFVAEAVIWRPRLFLEWFEDRPMAFASLLKLVEESYFVAEKESDVEGAEKRRIRMIESLDVISDHSGAKSLKSALEKARVRLID